MKYSKQKHLDSGQACNRMAPKSYTVVAAGQARKLGSLKIGDRVAIHQV